MLVMMQFWCSDCWSLVLYSQGYDSCDAFSGALETIPKPSQPPFLPSFLAQPLEMGSGLYHVSSWSSTLSWILSFKKSFCVHNSLGKTFVKKVKPTKLPIMLKLSTSVRHNEIILKWSTMSNTTWSCSSDQKNVQHEKHLLLHSSTASHKQTRLLPERARVWWVFFFSPAEFFPGSPAWLVISRNGYLRNRCNFFPSDSFCRKESRQRQSSDLLSCISAAEWVLLRLLDGVFGDGWGLGLKRIGP